MKRALIFSSILIATDQFLKFFFQFNFYDKKLMILDKLGFTYITNPGIYISLGISDLSMVILQIISLSAWILLIYALKYHQTILGNSIIIELAFAFLTTGILGNLVIDRIMFGYIRDYLILPMGIANLADFCGIISLFLFGTKICVSKEMRYLLLNKSNTTSIITGSDY